MKKLVFMCIATIIVTKLYAQTSGYWYKTEYISLNPIPDSTQLVISDNSVYSRNNQKYEHRLHKVTFNKAPKEMGQLKKNSYVSCLYKDSRGYTTYVLPMVCVGTENETAIKEIIEKYEGFLNLESQIGSAYYLSGPFNNAEEVLQMVCEVSDMDGVIWCQPDMTTNAGTTNDYYSEQWYLNGTNSFGINVEPAWNIVQVNSDIVVAVIDDGVDYLGTLKHEDLADYVIEGYTVGDINSKGNPKNDNLFDEKAVYWWLFLHRESD